MIRKKSPAEQIPRLKCSEHFLPSFGKIEFPPYRKRHLLSVFELQYWGDDTLTISKFTRLSLVRYSFANLRNFLPRKALSVSAISESFERPSYQTLFRVIWVQRKPRTWLQPSNILLAITRKLRGKMIKRYNLYPINLISGRFELSVGYQCELINLCKFIEKCLRCQKVISISPDLANPNEIQGRL